MDSLVIKAIPTVTLGFFAVALKKILRVGQHIMLPGHVENLIRPGALEHLVNRVKFRGLRQMAEVARVDDEIRRLRHGIDPCHRLLEGGRDILVGFPVEPDMAVADLDKGEISRLPAGVRLGRLADDLRAEDSAAEAINNARPHPSHAFEESATVNAVLIVIIRDLLFHDISFPLGYPVSGASGSGYWRRCFRCVEMIGSSQCQSPLPTPWRRYAACLNHLHRSRHCQTIPGIPRDACS